MKKYLKIIVLLTLSIFILISPTCTFASSVLESIDVNNLDLTGIEASKLSDVENKMEELTKATATSNIDAMLKIYEELSKIISNKELATFIDNNKSVLSNAGLSKNLLSTSSSLLKNFDTETILDIVRNDLDIESVIANSKEGLSSDDIVRKAIKNTTTSEKIKIVSKLVFSNGYFRLLFALFIVLGIYSVIITSFIFKKAKKQPWATYIPIYRDIIHLKLCNFSPFVLILLFIPIVGWFALLAIGVVGKFELSKNFGHGFLFGLGLLFFSPFFRTYLAFSSDVFKKEE